MLNERLDKLDTLVYLFRFEADKVREPPGNAGRMLYGATKNARPFIERYVWPVVRTMGVSAPLRCGAFKWRRIGWDVGGEGVVMLLAGLLPRVATIEGEAGALANG